MVKEKCRQNKTECEHIDRCVWTNKGCRVDRTNQGESTAAARSPRRTARSPHRNAAARSPHRHAAQVEISRELHIPWNELRVFRKNKQQNTEIVQLYNSLVKYETLAWQNGNIGAFSNIMDECLNEKLLRRKRIYDDEDSEA